MSNRDPSSTTPATTPRGGKEKEKEREKEKPNTLNPLNNFSRAISNIKKDVAYDFQHTGKNAKSKEDLEKEKQVFIFYTLELY